MYDLQAKSASDGKTMSDEGVCVLKNLYTTKDI
jgi:hypothetical protein